jgi:hypothetical protein
LGGTGAAALGGVALAGLSWSRLAAAEPGLPQAPPRRPLLVKPVLVYDVYERRPQTSWRAWGGIQTPADAEKEICRIKSELEKLRAVADFPVDFLPLAAIRNVAQLAGDSDVAKADVLLVYAAGVVMCGFDYGKNVIFFLRHKSGPLYYGYEGISANTLRKFTDERKLPNIDDQDVVVDSQDEILWRLRSLCGLVNTVGSKVIAVGGPGGWAQPGQVVPNLVRKKWKFEIVTVPYPELGQLIQDARADRTEVALAKKRTADYLKIPHTSLETPVQPLENAFLLEQVFRKLMAREHCRAMTINGCMGTIMPISETTACMPLSTLNDDGFMAFCESDFVVIPGGILLRNITNRPHFMNDPTYPHDGVITLAHCTGPRKMDGRTNEPVRLLTHFESDYGVAPKVRMRAGQVVTNVVADFKAQRWVGLLGEIVEATNLPICRNQIDIKFHCSSQLLAERMPGFHWMTFYGDYLKETGYALKRIPIKWEVLS